jgi:hypothetical protein
MGTTPESGARQRLGSGRGPNTQPAALEGLNQNNFRRLSTAIDLRLDNDPGTVDEFDGQFTVNQLFSLQNDYRRRRDYAVLGVGAGYLFQVLDAYAAGHLVDFDVSPNLSAQIRPAFGPQTTFGAQLTLAWH